MRLDMFLNFSTKFNNLSRFSLSNYDLMVKNTQAGLINHLFIFCSTLILITPVVEQELYDWYVFAVEMGEWGPYEALTPTEKLVIWFQRLWGALWVSNCLLVWSILTLVVVAVCLINRFVFSAQRAYMCPSLVR